MQDFTYFCKNDFPVNLELYIARRLLGRSEKMSVSVPIVKIALVGIALGVCVMLLAIFITGGFKKEITDKLTGFSSHINIVTYGNNNYYSESRLHLDDTLRRDLLGLQQVKGAYGYITKPSIFKSTDEIHGTLLYGVDLLYDQKFMREHLKEGGFPDYSTAAPSNDILMSSSVAAMLGVKCGDKIQAHFVQEPPRVRVFTIYGIYETGFKEYDDLFVLCDIRHLQRINGWQPNEVSGIAVELHSMDEIPAAVDAIEQILPWGEEDGIYFKVRTIYDMSPQIFDWLGLLDMNVWIIMILLVTVAGFNMVSGLFILILDKTTLIGIMKALGYKNVNLRKLFLYISLGLIGRGLLWGNAAALVLGFLQLQFGFIHLDPDVYYMNTVPLLFNVWNILLLDVGVLVVSTIMLVVPTMLISRINPIKAIRFE